MSRRVLGVSSRLHEEISTLADEIGLPMTVVLDNLMARAKEIDWEVAKLDYVKPSWANIRKVVDDYRKKFPDADDLKLSQMTGFSVAQVETVTHSAHKRCIAYMRRGGKKVEMPKQCAVSPAFANRIWEQFFSGARVPKGERYLFEKKR